MPPRGFCQHGKVWTTCPICGKDVIAAASKRGSKADEFADLPHERKKPARRAPAEEGAAEEPVVEEEPAEGEG